MAESRSEVYLHAMTDQAFERWSARLIEDYAGEHVKAGNWSASEALAKARKSIEDLLPDGVDTREHHLFTIMDSTGKQAVGVLWLGVNPRMQDAGFIYDLEIDEPFRRQGYATAAMKALEEKARQLGMAKLALHVFGHNAKARSLYEKLGYGVTDISMAKEL